MEWRPRWIRFRGLCVQNVLWLDDKAPASPDCAGGSKSGVLGEGEGLGWAPEVGDTGEDECPLGVVLAIWYGEGSTSHG